MQGDASIQKIIAAADGTLWVFEQLYTYTYNLPEDFDASTDDQWNYYQEGESKTRLVHLDAEGKTLKDIELSADDSSSASSSGGAQASGFLVDDSGNIYTTDYQNIFVYDSEGKLLFQLSASQNGGDLRQYSGTQIGVITWSGDSMLECRIPAKSQFRTFFLSPMMVPIASIILVWQVLFHANGAVNEFLAVFGADKIDWLKSDYCMRFAQVSCFLPADAGKTVSDIRSFEQTLDSEMVTASLTAPEGGSLYDDAWSCRATLSIEGGKGSTTVKTIGVGGDWFLFHPLELRSGSYITSDDYMVFSAPRCTPPMPPVANTWMPAMVICVGAIAGAIGSNHRKKIINLKIIQ